MIFCHQADMISDQTGNKLRFTSAWFSIRIEEALIA